LKKVHLSPKLAIILHADVVSSTSLIHQNESLAHERIQAAFNNFAETIIAYGGVAREIRGDALVAERTGIGCRSCCSRLSDTERRV